MTVPRILIIAGSDSGGGAGIQADIKTVTLLGGHAMTAVTALTAQNTTGVYGIHPVPSAFVAEQIRVVIDDLGVDVVKIGMLPNAATIRAVAHALPPEIPIVLDPVMIATSGSRLVEPEAIEAMTLDLLPRASLLTPNIPEAQVLAKHTINDEAAMVQAGTTLKAMGPASVLMKGGHLSGDDVCDILVADTITRWREPKIQTTSTHGTGCTLASAVATELGKGAKLEDAVTHARSFVRSALIAAPGFGQGNGPMALYASSAD